MEKKMVKTVISLTVTVVVLWMYIVRVLLPSTTLQWNITHLFTKKKNVPFVVATPPLTLKPISIKWSLFPRSPLITEKCYVINLCRTPRNNFVNGLWKHQHLYDCGCIHTIYRCFILLKINFISTQNRYRSTLVNKVFGFGIIKNAILPGSSNSAVKIIDLEAI